MPKLKPVICKYRFKGGSYPAIFITVDAVVFGWDSRNDLRILTITRKDDGKIALPGGFVDYKETLLNAAIRECKEETGIKVDILDYCGEQIFDCPTRDAKKGNRRISVAHMFQLNDLAVCRAGDDAATASWMHMYHFMNIDQKLIHGDHREIVYSFIKKVKVNF